MAGVNVKMGVSGVSEFKRAMNDAKAAVKTFDDELKLNEAQLKLTGNQELYMSNKVKLLKDQIEAQKKVCQQAEQALKDMEKNGVSKASSSYQKMRQAVLQSATKLQEMKTNLKDVETGTKDAATGADTMNTSLKEIGKGVSWDNLAEGLGKVNGMLQNGARAAINMGKKIAQSAMGSTGWADDILTRAAQYGVTPEELQRMEHVSALIDTDVETIIKARQKLMKGVGDGSEKTMGFLSALGIEYNGDAEKTFWETGKAIMELADEAEREAAAQNLFGKSWRELIPLFQAGPEKYKKAMEETTVLTNDQVEKLGEADDAFQKIQQQIETIKNQFWADNADKITELLNWIIANKESVVAGITAIGAAFGTLKIAEFAANLGKTIDGFRQLGLLGGAGKAAASAAGAGGTASASALGAKALSFLGGGGGTLFGVLGAGLLPAILANNASYGNSKATMNRRLATAGSSTSMEAMFLAQAAQALNIDWGKNQDYSTIERMLLGMNSRSGIEMSKLHNMLNGSTTSQGNYTWNELQRLWGGEEMDAGRLVAIMESVADAYEARIEMLERQNEGGTQNTAGEVDMEGMANTMAAAAKQGIEGANITVVVSQGVLDGITNNTDKSFGSRLLNFFGG